LGFFVRAPKSTSFRLANGLAHFPDQNRKLAIEGLLRNENRQRVLIAALEKGSVKAAWITPDQRARLLKIDTRTWHERAARVFQEESSCERGEK